MFKVLAGWPRRSLRGLQLRLWKNSGRLHHQLKPLCYKPSFKAVAMSKWNTLLSPLAGYAMPNSWFDQLSMFDIGSVKTGVVSPVVI